MKGTKTASQVLRFWKLANMTLGDKSCRSRLLNILPFRISLTMLKCQAEKNTLMDALDNLERVGIKTCRFGSRVNNLRPYSA